MRTPPRLFAATLFTGLAVSACAVSAPPSVPPVQPAAAPSVAPMRATIEKVSLGKGASLHGKRVFPASNPWNTPVDTEPVDPNSAALIASIGADTNLHPDFGADWNGGPFGIPYVVVKGSQKKVKVTFTYADESDKGKYAIPKSAPVEKGSDRHVIVLDRDHWKLYELFNAKRVKGTTRWKAGSGAVFNLKSNALRPAGWTSADAAGLPIFPGLARYDEVKAGIITHALRFTVANTRRAYVSPARHYASDDTDADLPPMGMRVRLKAAFDISGYPKEAKVILQAMKTYGMIVADNGSNWFVSGAPDKRWSDDRLGALKSVPGSAFEVIAMKDVTTG